MKNFKKILKNILQDPHSDNKISSLRLLLWLTILFYFSFLSKKLILDTNIIIPESLDTLVLYLTGGIVLGKFQKKTEFKQTEPVEKKVSKKFIVEESGHDSDWSGK